VSAFDPGGRAASAVRRMLLRLGLSVGAETEAGLTRYARLLSTDPAAPLSRGDRELGRLVDAHLADSLVALELDAMRDAVRIADVGSGAGLPGLALALALPAAQSWLIEANTSKCRFLERAVAQTGARAVEVVAVRAEEWAQGEARERADVVTARALAALDVTLEYGAPLARVGGVLIVWRGRREPRDEAAAAAAAIALGLQRAEVRRVSPFPGAQHRHLHVFAKVRETPSSYPRRVGMAAKRRLAQRSASDRPRR
jgi:16S rRNA (guanine527-N7)-methyltransferase